jgi:hypothetical protein
MEDTRSSSEPQIEDDNDLYNYFDSVAPAPDDFSENYDADCVRKTGNFASSDTRYLFDYTSPKDERKVLTRERLQYVSPKLLTLLDEIERQDHADIAEFGHTFKHFIFSSIKSGTGGAKIIATALIDIYNMTLGYSVQNRKLAFLQENSIVGSNGTFYLLSSVGVFGKPIPVPMRKEILKKFNSRPDNVHGDVSRIIVMDSGFKEGVDLFDVKYVHIFEPQTTFADQKQAIGRATRTCGQKGLEFHPNRGWQLHVNIYDSIIPEVVSFKYKDSRSVHEMYLKVLGIDVRMLNLVSDMENLYAKGAVDHDLNVPIHDFGRVEDDAESNEDLDMHGGKKMELSNSKRRAIEEMLKAKGANGNSKLINALVLPKYKNKVAIPKIKPVENRDLEKETLELLNLTRDAKLIGVLQGLNVVNGTEGEPETYEEMREYIKDNYEHEYKWADAKMENLCPKVPTEPTVQGTQNDDGKETEQKDKSSIIHFNKTQNFVRRYFTPDLVNHKGILLAHSVGTGKTCTAIATATTSFEKEGYTILWVTRTTLKTDIWKNMFDQICSDSLRQLGTIPSSKDTKARMRLLSKAWSIRPMSYKQFSNLVSGKNSMYQELVKRNGTLDPLRKTLLIIDEAHKLYGETDLSALERPDMAAFHESVMRSYEVSGADSVRLMLMTATPITTSPMEFVKLMNLCKERPRQMETEFAAFSQEYLDGAGRFTGAGETRFLDEISGYVSYLNREKDARVFAQPIIKRVNVPLLPEGSALFEEYDAPLIRALEKPRIAEMEARVKQDLEKIEKANRSFKGITAKSFDGMKLLCDHASVKTKKAKAACKKAATQTIKEIVAYVKERKSETKDLTKEVKESLKDFKRTLKEKTDKINERVRAHRGTRKAYKSSEEMRDSTMSGGAQAKERPIEDIDNDYQRYMQSAFHNIKSKCRIPAKRAVFESHPTIMELQSDIQGLREAAKTKDKDAKLFAKNIRIQMKGLPDVQGTLGSEGPSGSADSAVQKNDLKMQIKTMTIETRKEITKFNEKIAKKEKFTRKLKQLLERKYKKSLKDRAKAEKDIANDVAEIDEESKELKKKVNEFHDLADIEDDKLREFAKAKTQEFVDQLGK